MTNNFKNCTECPHSNIIRDPDPTDSFNYDDVAVVCTLTKNEKQDVNSKYIADRQKCAIITCVCRPYRVEKESSTPSWCPFDKLKIKGKVDEF